MEEIVPDPALKTNNATDPLVDISSSFQQHVNDLLVALLHCQMQGTHP